MTETRTGRALPTCAATHCENLPVARAGFCVQHVRCLRLTARVSDAVREFLRSVATPFDDENDGRADSPIEQSVIKAGEHFAHGLGLLVGSQFGEDVRWNPSPIHVERYRWRTEFIWQVGGSGESDETAESDADDESISESESEYDDFDQIGAMAR